MNIAYYRDSQDTPIQVGKCALVFDEDGVLVWTDKVIFIDPDTNQFETFSAIYKPLGERYDTCN